jgi:predicted AAA+ superfamily ATPase
MTSNLSNDDQNLLTKFKEYLLKNPSIFIDTQKISRNFQTTPKKITQLLLELENTQMGERVYQFKSEHLKTNLIPHFKFYFYDYQLFTNGLYQYRPEQDGPLFEQYFFSKMRKYTQAPIATFRTLENIEIDFILELKDKLICFEIKKDQFIYAGDLAGLHYFDKIFTGPKDLYVLHNGTRNNLEGKVAIMPMNLAIDQIFNVELIQKR